MLHFRRLLFVPVLLTLALGACDNGAPSERLLGPETATLAKGKDGAAKLEKETKEKKGRKVRVKKKNGKVVELNLATGYLPDSHDWYVKAEIGAEGGRLETSGHRLDVPAGAVDALTTFKMRQYRRVLEDGSVVVAVELRAIRTEADGTERDIGVEGFAVPLKLALTYRWSKDVDDGNAAASTIVWLKSDTEAEEVDSSAEVDVGAKRLKIDLWHFSDYALIFP